MPNFDTVEDTLFVPMLGRIYASEKYPNILSDKKALELKNKLPKNLKGQDTQTQYTLMASATRSVNMDRYIKDFLKRNENGVIVQLGAGLETTFYRNDNNNTHWFEVDLPDVIEYRQNLLGENERDTYISGDAFCEDWIKQVREVYPNEPILVTASGLFYYFKRSDVIDLIKMLKNYGNIEVVFDCFNLAGIKQIVKYMKQVGHPDARMYFYVDDIKEIASAVDATYAFEEPYYKYISKKGLNIVTKVSMLVSDKFMMVKMAHLKLN